MQNGLVTFEGDSGDVECAAPESTQRQALKSSVKVDPVVSRPVRNIAEKPPAKPYRDLYQLDSKSWRGSRVSVDVPDVVPGKAPTKEGWVVGPGPESEGKPTACIVFDDWSIDHILLKREGKAKLQPAPRILPVSSTHSKGSWTPQDVEMLELWAPNVPPETSKEVWNWIACQLGRFQPVGHMNPCSTKWWGLCNGARLGKGRKHHVSGVTPKMLAQALASCPAKKGTSFDVRDALKRMDSGADLCMEVASGTKTVPVWEKQASHLLAVHPFFTKMKPKNKRYIYSLSKEGERVLREDAAEADPAEKPKGK